MEPIDDILIPRAKSGPGRFRARHVLRTLALLLVALAIAYGVWCLSIDALASKAQRTADLLGVSPVLLFGVCLWWYAGRANPELSQPLFRAGQPDDPQMNARRGFWLSAGMLSGFIGLAAVTLGAVVVWHGETLKATFPILKTIQISSRPLLIIGALLMVLAAVALALAQRKDVARS